MDNFTQEQLTSLKINVRAYYDYQNERLSMDNRLGVKKDGELKKLVPPRDPALLLYLKKRRDDIISLEEALEKEIATLIKLHPLYIHFLKDVKGCGPVMSAVIISEFDIHIATTVSKLWAFAGLAPGKDKKVKGQKCPYNQFLRAKLCGVLGGSFLKCKSVPYSVYYYDVKNRLENSDNMVMEISKKGAKPAEIAWKDAKKDHRHKAATRKMIKMFLKDLYVAWRTLEDLPVRKPYAEEYLGRTHAMAA